MVARSGIQDDPRAFRYTTRGRTECDLPTIAALPTSNAPENTVVVIENISIPWAQAIANTWSIQISFFEAHASNPAVASSPVRGTAWDAVFSSGSQGCSRTTEKFGRGMLTEYPPRAASLSPHVPQSWHVDGIFEYEKSETAQSTQMEDPQFMQRLLEHSDKWGWQASTQISCYGKRVHGSFMYLILIDAPMRCLNDGVLQKQPKVQLCLPISNNRGGALLPSLFNSKSGSLESALEQFLSHGWHLNLLFSPKPLSAESFLYLLVASTWEQNFRYLDANIKRISFKDIRRPSSRINDQLHDLREQLSSLRADVATTRDWIPGSVKQELMEAHASSNMYVGHPEWTLSRILGRADDLERFLMDSFNLLISSTSLINTEQGVEDAKRGQRLTQLAFIYLPLTFITGAFGMNVKEITEPPISVWITAVGLVVTVLCTAIIFWALIEWEKLRERARARNESRGLRRGNVASLGVSVSTDSKANSDSQV